MKLRLRCSCGTEMLAATEVAGKQVRCVGCEQIILVPIPNQSQLTSLANSQPGPIKTSVPAALPTADAGSVSDKPIKAQSAQSANVVAARPVEVSPNPEPLADLPLPDPLETFSTPSYGTLSTTSKPKRSSQGGLNWKVLVGITGGVIGLFALIGVVALVINSSGNGRNSRGRNALGGGESFVDQLDFGAGSENASNTQRVTPGRTFPGMPGRPAFRPLSGTGVTFGTVRLNQPGPGGQMVMNVYMPPGSHADESLGCVLVAPAGTNLLVGNSVDGADYHDETLPYAEAGFVVIQYSLDGEIEMEGATEQQFSDAFRKFRMAMAGSMNTRLAKKYAEEQLNEVDPRRVYAAGHSSAGTVALNSTYYAHGLAGCAVFAPCSDPEAFHADLYAVPELNRVFPGMRGFDRMNSPMANTIRIRCPLFIFQATGDGVVDCDETRRFVEKVKRTNSNVEYVEVAGGDHYNSMIQQGIPAAVGWFKKLDTSLKR